MLYTKRGDTGLTDVCGPSGPARASKSSALPEALGSLDELNTWLGYCRSLSQDDETKTLCLALQHDLFAIQAELAGASRRLPARRLAEVERTIDAIEQELPPLSTFCLPGQTPDAARLDLARTIARRAERRVVNALETDSARLADTSLAYLNRLSSLLFTLARRANHRAGVPELAPHYYPKENVAPQ